MSSGATVLIPAYKPSEHLVNVVRELTSSDGVANVVVVDDGGGPEFKPIFDQVRAMPRTHVVRHAVNLGKGAALKTGMNHIWCEFPDAPGIVTADADGQHLCEDICKVAARLKENPDCLIMGSRKFGGEVPLRSKLGNIITRNVLKVVLGYALRDTQTGLRGIPRTLGLQLLKLKSRGYEFELDMLILCKQTSVKIVESDIQTVYLDGNQSSHFNPLLDSMRIYFALLRYLVTSIASAVVDNILFITLFFFAKQMFSELRYSILFAQVIGRALALIFNYFAVKKVVFASKQSNARVIPRFLLLVAASCAVSYMMITFMVEKLHMNVVLAKILAESIIFIPNFTLQRELVFGDRRGRDAIADTDDED